MPPEDSTPDPETLGGRLRTLRLERGLTMRQIEKRTRGKVRSGHLSQIEHGKVAEPSLGVLRALAEAFRMHLATLLTYLGLLDEPTAQTTRTEELVLSHLRDLGPDAQAEAADLLQFLVTRKSAHRE